VIAAAPLARPLPAGNAGVATEAAGIGARASAVGAWGVGTGKEGAGKAGAVQSQPELPPVQLGLHSDQVELRAKQRAPTSLQHCDSQQFSFVAAQLEPDATFEDGRISSNFEHAHVLS